MTRFRVVQKQPFPKGKPMSSPIALHGFDEDQHRQFVRMLSEQAFSQAREETPLALRRRQDRECGALRVLSAVDDRRGYSKL